MIVKVAWGVCIVAGVLFGGLVPVWGEEAAIILSRSAGPYQEAFQGFVASVNFSYQIFNMEGDDQKWDSLPQSIRQGGFRIVVTIGSEATLKARQLPGNIPVVYAMVLAPISGANGNISGVHLKIAAADQLHFIRKMLPAKKRIGIIYNPAMTGQDIALARTAAVQEGVALLPIAVVSSADVPGALSKLTPEVVDLIWIIPDPVVGQPDSVQLFIAHSRQQKLPVFGFTMPQAKAGLFAAFSVQNYDIGQQAAALAIKIRSEQARDVHEGPRKFVVYVNAETQKSLGLPDFSDLPEIRIIHPF
jgi:putative ABC transport system substrate-binding protein